jgi:hypothetical protein
MPFSQTAMINIFLVALLLAVALSDYVSSKSWRATEIDYPTRVTGNLSANVILPKPPVNF